MLLLLPLLPPPLLLLLQLPLLLLPPPPQLALQAAPWLAGQCRACQLAATSVLGSGPAALHHKLAA
jgi:hypothetical protein